jgi:signal transduction histidine kinase
MSARPLSPLLRPTPPAAGLGIAVALAFITAETLAIYLLRSATSDTVALGVVYLVGVLVVSTVWGLAVGAATAVLSTAAFDFFHVPPEFAFTPVRSSDWVVLSVFLGVALALGSVAELARSRAAELDERRVEADLAAYIARRLLHTGDLRPALQDASARIAHALGLSNAAIELKVVAGDERRTAVPLGHGNIAVGTLLVPADLSPATEQRLRERVVPSLEALVRAACDRERIASALEVSRHELRTLAGEQAALRRVATLVARAVPPIELFDATAAEVGRLLGADVTRLLRYEPDGTAIDVGGRTEPGVDVASRTGTRHALQPDQIAGRVSRTGRPARVETYEGVPGPVAARLREHGVRSGVGAPVVVEGRLWGVMISAWTHDRAVSADIEERMAQFTELIAAAIANASSRAELAASRARVVTASDEGRRRLVRDLHDGVQQRLVQTVIILKLAKRAFGDASGTGVELVSEALDHAERTNAELRDLAHGILPSALTSGGLRAGVDSLLSRVRLPVSVHVIAERMEPGVEATAYFIVAEALTNTIKHAGASHADITAAVEDSVLRLVVRDDGVGGARIEGSSGLVGLRDRAAALNGTLEVESPPGAGTLVTATLPIQDAARAL